MTRMLGTIAREVKHGTSRAEMHSCEHHDHLQKNDHNTPNELQNYLIENSLNRTVPLKQITLVDDYRFTRECLAKAFMLLNSDFFVHSYLSVKQCISQSDGRHDLILYYSHDDGPSPDVLLADLRHLRSSYLSIPIVVLSDATTAATSETIRAMFHNGADGFIPTRFVGIPVAFAAIHFVRAGGKFAPPDLLFDTNPEIPRATEPAETLCGSLTSRQNAVFALLKQGKANKIIAYELGVSESTVKVHIRNIMRRIGATNRTQAVYKAQTMASLSATTNADAPPPRSIV